MEARAIEKYLRISPRKVKFVIDLVRNKPVEEAIGLLSLTPKKAAVFVRKAIQSAVANAIENFKEYKVSEEDLIIKEIYVNEGPTLKRFKPRARGRADRVLKRTSHITVLVSDLKSKASKVSNVSNISKDKEKEAKKEINKKLNNEVNKEVNKEKETAGQKKEINQEKYQKKEVKQTSSKSDNEIKSNDKSSVQKEKEANK